MFSIFDAVIKFGPVATCGLLCMFRSFLASSIPDLYSFIHRLSFSFCICWYCADFIVLEAGLPHWARPLFAACFSAWSALSFPRCPFYMDFDVRFPPFDVANLSFVQKPKFCELSHFALSNLLHIH